jgi:hypothetical protein
MTGTGPVDASAPPPPPRRGQPVPPPATVTQHDLEVYWSHQYGDAQLPALRAAYPQSDYAALAARSHGAHSAAQLAGYQTETDFAYICTARWASEYFSASARIGFGRIVASEIEAPNMLAILV